ncbi:MULTISPECIES: PAS domain-containing protein [unclassified Bradyrhizobium]|uniref:PAS domain-containing protein n=1 Tax=unclassified Bradyrhizobium TaxID=2631580 RepID=UPI0029164521|nr:MULTISPECIES: PAS domain-containing protein [unclassified Bradyrhizobium]
MSQTDLQLLGLSDPRLAVHAVGALPAWLWSADGRRVLWANPIGAKAFGATDTTALAARSFGPADVHRRQIVQLWRRLPENGAMRLERLRGFGAPLGTLATCGCARIDLPDGSHAVLITSTDNAGRSIPLVERLQRLVAHSEAALIAFTRDGLFAGASTAGRLMFGYRDLADGGLAGARDLAIADGQAEVQFGPARAVLYRVGSGQQIGLVLARMPGRSETPHAHPLADAEQPPLPQTNDAAAMPEEASELTSTMTSDETPAPPAYEAPELSNEAPSEVLLIDRAAEAAAPADAANSIEAAAEPNPIGDGHTDQHSGAADVEAPAPSSKIVAAEAEHASAQDVPSSPSTLVGAPHDQVSPAISATTDNGAEPAGNVVPFRPPGESRFPALTAVENNAFHELARQLSARLEGEMRAAPTELLTAMSEMESSQRVSEPPFESSGDTSPLDPFAADARAADSHADWLSPEPPPVQGDSQRDRILLDLLPTAVLIYRLDRLLYANGAFLAQMGYPDLAALEQAGGLDALYVELGASPSASTAGAGTPVTISVADGPASEGQKAAARLFTIAWDGDIAHALVFAPPANSPPPQNTAPVEPPAAPAPPPPLVMTPPEAGHADAEDLGAILDVTAEGVLMFDAGGNIHACNRSAEALFGYDGPELVRRNLIELFAPDSTRLVLDYLDGVRQAGATTVLEQPREVLGRLRQGGIVPLTMTIGRTRPDGPNFFAVVRDLSQARRGENELLQARRLADRAATAKADMLARISHEVRAPLNAIIGFAEVMIGERFGAIGNKRYVDYLKDIRTSGERVVALIDDMLELSRVETGRIELSFSNQNLNELVENCVAVMQPQANRARIIIRSSLSHALPPVVADARALRQISLNLISSSISLANPGGQVIVSTALSDFGEVVLRVRDTGHALNAQEVAAALEPFRSRPPSDQASETSGLSLSLTKALVEANRAQFHIKPAPKSGTLMEVVFSRAMARNQSLG